MMMARAALAIATTVPNGVLADKACDKAYTWYRDLNIELQVTENNWGKSFDEVMADPGGAYSLVRGTYIGRAIIAESAMREQRDVLPYTASLLSVTHELIVCGRAEPGLEEQMEIAGEWDEHYPPRIMDILLNYATDNQSEQVAQ